MTQQEQEELTRQAMERAQKTTPIQEKVTKNQKVPKTPAAKVAKTPKEPKLLPTQRKLGDRIVTLQSWAGKTKKKFKKEFEFVDSPEDIDLPKIIEILVYDQIQEDYQLTELELQYLLTELKELSLGSEIECQSPCKSCGNHNKITSTTKEAVHFKADTLPAKFKDWNFKNITRSEFLSIKNEIMDSNDYDGLTSETDIELACKITKGKRTPNEMIELIDETPLMELNEMMEAYVSNMAEFSITKEHKCQKCGVTSKFDIDIITGIFETLAK